MRRMMIIGLVVACCSPLIVWAAAPALPAPAGSSPAVQPDETGIPGVEMFKVTRGGQPRAFDHAAPDTPADTQQLVTMIVKDADIGSVLQLLATQFKLNLLTTSDIKGTVSFQFADVPLQTALDVLVKSAQANYLMVGNVILVKPVRMELHGDLTTRVFNLDYAEAADVAAAVKKILTTKGSIDISYRRVANGGSSSRSSVLIVYENNENMGAVERLIRELDQPVPQIAIEAKFIETTLDDNSLYGIDWQIIAGANAKVANSGNFSAGADITFPIHLNELMLGEINLGQLSAVLDILKTRGNGRLLANPRAITLDNQTAVMTISTDIPIREVRIDPGTQAQTITWRRQPIPISLTVTPHVLADGTVDMEVMPSVEAIVGYSGPPGDQQPITSKREAKTQIRVRDGEVAVIGGLVREEQTKNVKKVPLLGDIPVLGELFKSTSMSTKKTDLLIFIIPHVLPAQ